MEPTLLEELKNQLQKKKEQLEAQLSSFAIKDPHLKDDWDTKYPRVPEGNIEEAADEVEEYSTKLTVEFSLENQLKDVNDALLRMEKGNYGMCEKCGNPIAQERLQASPEARLCSQCK
ncbi:MAG: TraR/DksA C4-type zinc finger protein [Patescibacteria group bacterium]